MIQATQQIVQIINVILSHVFTFCSKLVKIDHIMYIIKQRKSNNNPVLIADMSHFGQQHPGNNPANGPLLL